MASSLDELPDLSDEQVRTARGQYTQLYSTWPEEVRGPLVEQHLATWRTQIAETENFETEVYDELRSVDPFLTSPYSSLPLAARIRTGRVSCRKR